MDYFILPSFFIHKIKKDPEDKQNKIKIDPEERRICYFLGSTKSSIISIIN